MLKQLAEKISKFYVLKFSSASKKSFSRGWLEVIKPLKVYQ